jgi:uncharacterized repeat protein (TIGR01451 family)
MTTYAERNSFYDGSTQIGDFWDLQLSTDLADYAPGDTAYFIVSGFEEGATIEFQVLHVDDAGEDGEYGTLDDVLDAGYDEIYGTDDDGFGPAEDYDSHGTFYITDGGVGDLDGIVNGEILTSWYVDPNDSLDAQFLLVAREVTAGEDWTFGTDDDVYTGGTGTTAFTDAEGGIDKVYKHWADGDTDSNGPGQFGEWQNNILSDGKSDYFEGEVIPHVFVYKASNNTPLTNGESYTITITYNYYQQNTNAGGFAFITDFDTSRTPDPLDATDPYLVPTEDAAFTNGGGIQGAFHTVDADITDVSDVVYTGSGTLDGEVTVTFTYTGTTTTDGIAEIYYGLYIAEPGQVPDQGAGPTNGASEWTGGSLQTTVAVEGSGAFSIQLNPAAIIAGEISGVKYHDLNANGDMDEGEPLLPGWTIYLDNNNNGTLDWADGNGNTVWDAGEGEQWTITDALGEYSFSVTPDSDKDDGEADNDPYFVREILMDGWAQTEPADPDFYGPLIISAEGGEGQPQYLHQDFGNVFVAVPDISIDIEKFTCGVDADSETGPSLVIGSTVTWTYEVTNIGGDPLSNITVTDSDAGVTPVYVSGDDGNDDIMDVGEIWIYEAEGIVTAGQYVNVGTATGDFTDILLNVHETDDFDPSHYIGLEASIDIDKYTCSPGQDNPTLIVGETVTWYYVVTNNGEHDIDGATIAVSDNNEGPANLYNDNGDGDGILSAGESWTYTLTGVVGAGGYSNTGSVTASTLELGWGTAMPPTPAAIPALRRRSISRNGPARSAMTTRR